MSKRRDIREEKAYRAESAMLAGVDADRSKGQASADGEVGEEVSESYEVIGGGKTGKQRTIHL